MPNATLPNVELVKRLEAACQMFPLTNVIFHGLQMTQFTYRMNLINHPFVFLSKIMFLNMS